MRIIDKYAEDISYKKTNKIGLTKGGIVLYYYFTK